MDCLGPFLLGAVVGVALVLLVTAAVVIVGALRNFEEYDDEYGWK